jgi:exodeoxyribonuclease VII small subunit
MAKSKSPSDEAPKSFEASMLELEQIVRKLESGSLPLEDMLADYAKAVETIQSCHNQLESARRRIAQLQSVKKDGTAVVKPWDDTAPTLPDASEAPSRRRST